MNIALVAHDDRKTELIEWAAYNFGTLTKHTLYATGTTGKLLSNTSMICVGDEGGIREEFPFKDKVIELLSGPLGGDQQIGAMIAEGKIDVLIFFCDNLIAQGHQTDVSALTRLASLYNIAFATNRTTADMILTSALFDNHDYNRIIPDSINAYRNRIINN